MDASSSRAAMQIAADAAEQCTGCCGLTSHSLVRSEKPRERCAGSNVDRAHRETLQGIERVAATQRTADPPTRDTNNVTERHQ